MKNLKKISILFLLTFITTECKRTTVDKALALIYHSEGTSIILQSDLRPDLSDQTPTLKDALLKELIILDAKKYKITVTDADIDRHLARIQESLKKTREDLAEFFKERGYSFEQAKKELEKGLLIEMTVSERVRSKAFVSESTVKKYYEEHPIVDYTIRQAFVPYGYGSKAIMRATIDKQIESGTIDSVVSWGDPVVLKETDIAPEKAFIKELQPGHAAKINEAEDGIMVLKIESKQKLPYDLQKKQIMQELGAEKQKKALDEYMEGLLARAHVRYLN